MAACRWPTAARSRYAAFVAPALLATASMNGAIAESIFNVFFKLNFAKIYDGILATPLGIRGDRPGRDHLGADPRHAVRGRASCG